MAVMYFLSSGKCTYSGGETGHNEILTFKLNLTWKSLGQSPPQMIVILTKVFCTSGPNLVILKWVTSYRTDRLRVDTRMDREMQVTTIPEG